MGALAAYAADMADDALRHYPLPWSLTKYDAGWLLVDAEGFQIWKGDRGLDCISEYLLRALNATVAPPSPEDPTP
jgi:hypothetical protein